MAGEEQRSDRVAVAISTITSGSRASLRAAIWAAGAPVVGEAVRCADALALVRRVSPDRRRVRRRSSGRDGVAWRRA